MVKPNCRMESNMFYNYDMEENRVREFPTLKDITYVDHAGATLYSKSQIEAFQNDILNNLYGNPHSACASSKLTSDCIDHVRFRMLKLFHTTPEEYSVIFTSGCTAALKLLADSFSFSKLPPEEERDVKDGVSSDGAKLSTDKQEGIKEKKSPEARASTKANFVPLAATSRRAVRRAGYLCYLQDNHTSVQGMRELMADDCRAVLCLTEAELLGGLTAQSLVCGQLEVREKLGKGRRGDNCLLAYPGQSNFSGRKYPLQWIADARDGRLGFQSGLGGSWFVLLDAASLVATSPLDLTAAKPDFATVSLYKMFGFPTGLGALLVRNEVSWVLERRYYGGGTVAASTARERFCALKSSLSDRFEDGTLPFLDIIAVRHGLDTVEKLAGGLDRVSSHTFLIAQHFAQTLSSLRHANGAAVAEVFCHDAFTRRQTQGGIVNFVLKRPTGEYIGFAEVDKLAQLHDIHLRTGCFCNIGACQTFLGISSSTVRDNLDAGHVCGDDKDLINGRPTGSVRVSFGYMSTLSDAARCLDFIVHCFLDIGHAAATPAIANPDWFKPPINIANETTPSLASYTGNKQQSPSTIVSQTNGGGTLVKGNNQPDQPQNKGEHRSYGSGSQGMTDEEKHDVEGSQEREVTRSETGRWLTDICLYPIKSCGGFKVSEWELGERGLRYDRTWMIVADSGVVLGQKREPRLCLLRPFIRLQSGTMELTFPGMPHFSVPLDVSGDAHSVDDVNVCRNKVCRDPVTTVDCGDDVAQWVSEALEQSGLRLLRQLNDDTRRSRRPDLASDGDGSTSILSLANESQLLVLSRKSVRLLQARLADNHTAHPGQDVTPPPHVTDEDNLVDRFRANLVIDGGQPFDEESWVSLHCGLVRLSGQGRCSRCGMICLDQTTGERTHEPLKTLASWRGGKVYFGVYMRANASQSKQILKVGSEVTVV